MPFTERAKMVQFTTVDRNPTIIFKFHDGSEQTWQYHYGVEPEGWL
jgi:hypothetical protein